MLYCPKRTAPDSDHSLNGARLPRVCSKLECHASMQTNDDSIRNRARAAWPDDVLQVRSHRKPRRDLDVVIDFPNTFVCLDADGTGK